MRCYKKENMKNKIQQDFKREKWNKKQLLQVYRTGNRKKKKPDLKTANGGRLKIKACSEEKKQKASPTEK